VSSPRRVSSPRAGFWIAVNSRMMFRLPITIRLSLQS
jgi:hypothetical protein